MPWSSFANKKDPFCSQVRTQVSSCEQGSPQLYATRNDPLHEVAGGSGYSQPHICPKTEVRTHHRCTRTLISTHNQGPQTLPIPPSSLFSPLAPNPTFAAQTTMPSTHFQRTSPCAASPFRLAPQPNQPPTPLQRHLPCAANFAFLLPHPPPAQPTAPAAQVPPLPGAGVEKPPPPAPPQRVKPRFPAQVCFPDLG